MSLDYHGYVETMYLHPFPRSSRVASYAALSGLMVKSGLRHARPGSVSRYAGSNTRTSSVYCAADLVALEMITESILPGLIDDSFGSELSEE
jgi:hypothetical protein